MSSGVTAAALAGLLAAGGYWKRSLSLSGAVCALVVGWITLRSSVAMGAALIIFFLSGSLATRLGRPRKKRLEGPFYREGGLRSWVQVLSNAPATICCLPLLHLELTGASTPSSSSSSSWLFALIIPRLVPAYLAQMAAMQGDTLSSELGVLARSQPRLITSGAQVPPGTNGGVTLEGLAAATAGGASLGVCVALVSGLPVAALTGRLAAYALVGSLLDSVLGATLQFSGWDAKHSIVTEHPGPGVKRISGRPWLDNHQVNLLTSVLMMVVGLLTA